MKTVPGRRQFVKNMVTLGAGIYVAPFAGAAPSMRAQTVVLSHKVRKMYQWGTWAAT